MHGYTKPYFIDDTGRLFRDETGLKDHHDSIPFELTLGEHDFNEDLSKVYSGVIVDSEYAQSARVAYSIDGNDYKPLGQLDATSKKFIFPHDARGRKIQYQFTHNDTGQAPAINGISTLYSSEENNLG
jgi:hypothetical protein